MIQDISTIKFLLKKINWDFNNKGALNIEDIRPFDSRKFHWFPATFIPEIPFSLIEVLTKKDAVVYDPFAGSGTTFFQALLLNRNAVTSDSSSISIQYLQSLTNVIKNHQQLNFIHIKLRNLLKDYNSDKDYASEVLVKQRLLLQPWFHKSSLNEIAFLYNLYITNDDTLKSLIYILLAGSMKSICSQQKGWGYIADNVKPKDNDLIYKNAFNIFTKKMDSLINNIDASISSLSNNDFLNNIDLEHAIFQHNAVEKNILEDESVDVIITSPPYPNMIDYSKSQRLLYYLFDLEFKDDLQKEIGARAFRGRKKSVENYINTMQIVFQNLSKILKINGLICLVLPYYDDKKNNQIRQEAINTLLTWFEDYGFNKEAMHIRNIDATRKVLNTSQSSLNQEQIVIFRKIK